MASRRLPRPTNKRRRVPINPGTSHKQKSSPLLAPRVPFLPFILLNHFTRHFLAEPQTLASHYESLMACRPGRLFLRVRTRTGIRLFPEEVGRRPICTGYPCHRENLEYSSKAEPTDQRLQQAEFVGIFLYQVATDLGDNPHSPPSNHMQETDRIWVCCPKQL